jgi:hypothetical protein
LIAGVSPLRVRLGPHRQTDPSRLAHKRWNQTRQGWIGELVCAADDLE